MLAGQARGMDRSDRHVLDQDQPAVGKRRAAAGAFVVDSVLTFNWPVSEQELAAIELLLGDDLAKLLGEIGPN